MPLTLYLYMYVMVARLCKAVCLSIGHTLQYCSCTTLSFLIETGSCWTDILAIMSHLGPEDFKPNQANLEQKSSYYTQYVYYCKYFLY